MRRLFPLGFDPRGVGRHHVRPVEKICDAAKTFGFALRAIGAVRAIEPHQLGVGRWVDLGFDLKDKLALRRLQDRQRIGRCRIGLGSKRQSVDRKPCEREFIAVKYQRGGRRGMWRWLDCQPGAHAGLFGIERDIKLDVFDDPIRRAIILKSDRLGSFGTHRRSRMKGWRSGWIEAVIAYSILAQNKMRT